MFHTLRFHLICCGALLVAAGVAGCNSGPNSALAPALPPASTSGAVPASVTAANGYKVSVFAAPTGSTKPDSIVQIGSSVFVGFGDTVNPDGTVGSAGTTHVEILQYDLAGNLQKTLTVPGHNDGLMAYDNSTLWAMSNEDANPELVVINVATGTQKTYTAQPSLLSASGGLPHGGGLDDMVKIGNNVYVSASNPSVNPAATCAGNSSTPGCPNGVTTGPFVYTLSLNSDGATFNLTPVVASNIAATNKVTNASATFNITDTDSEVVSPDGSTLIVDGQQDSELALITNLSATAAISYLPLTFSGSPQQVDDTRFVPPTASFLLLADTPHNTIYRIDGAFSSGDAYSAGQTMLFQLNMTSGALTPVVTGFQAPHGLAFITPR